MAQSNPFIIGRGSEVTVALLPKGSRAEIVPQTITLGAIGAAAASSLTVAALASPILASATDPVFLSFVDALDETDRFVKVTAGAAAAATSSSVTSKFDKTSAKKVRLKAAKKNQISIYSKRSFLVLR